MNYTGVYPERRRRDGDGNRVQKSNGKLYWYGAGTEILDETDLSGNVTSEYVFIGGKRIARRDASNNIYYYAEDFIGSSRVMTTSNGTVCYEADFYPFGGERTITNTCPQNYKFQGKERDAETGNDDFGARYYSSSFGRWLSPDWSAIPAPVPYADLSNPQTLNLYQFVKNDPETFTDPDGHNECGPTCSAGLFNNAGNGGKLGQASPVEPNQSKGLDGAQKASDDTKKAQEDKTKKENENSKKTAAQSNEEKDHTVLVEKLKGEDGFIPGHLAISVDGDPPVGLEPNSMVAAAAASAYESANSAAPASVAGHVETVGNKRTVEGKAIIRVTGKQATAMKTAISKATNSPQRYDPLYNNCVTFVSRILGTGGVSSSSALTPGGFISDLTKKYPQ